jgi:hypothetical protein
MSEVMTEANASSWLSWTESDLVNYNTSPHAPCGWPADEAAAGVCGAASADGEVEAYLDAAVAADDIVQRPLPHL